MPNAFYIEKHEPATVRHILLIQHIDRVVEQAYQNRFTPKPSGVQR